MKELLPVVCCCIGSAKMPLNSFWWFALLWSLVFQPNATVFHTQLSSSGQQPPPAVWVVGNEYTTSRVGAVSSKRNQWTHAVIFSASWIGDNTTLIRYIQSVHFLATSNFLAPLISNSFSQKGKFESLLSLLLLPLVYWFSDIINYRCRVFGALATLALAIYWFVSLWTRQTIDSTCWCLNAN